MTARCPGADGFRDTRERLFAISSWSAFISMKLSNVELLEEMLPMSADIRRQA